MPRKEENYKLYSQQNRYKNSMRVQTERIENRIEA